MNTKTKALICRLRNRDSQRTRPTESKPLLVAVIILSVVGSTYSYDTLEVKQDVYVGSYSVIAPTIRGRAQQGIAANEPGFYTSAGGNAYGVVESHRLFKYDPNWGEDNVEVSFNAFFDGFHHLGDIDVYNDYVYGVLTDLGYYLDDLERIHIAWFHEDTLEYEDQVAVSSLVSLFPDLDDIGGVAFKDDQFYLVGYYDNDTDTPRIFSGPMDGHNPRALTKSYEIETWHANGLAFKGDYVFISWGPVEDPPTTAYIDIYEYPLTQEASPIRTYQYNAKYTHAEGITFDDDELWVAQNEYVCKLENPLRSITASSGLDGSIDPEGNIYVLEGGNKTFNATPDIGFEVDRWYVNGQDVGGGISSVLLQDIQEDKTVHVTFKLSGQGSETETFTATADTYTVESDPSGNRGTLTQFGIHGRMDYRQYGFVKFNVSSILSGSTITGVELRLYSYWHDNPSNTDTWIGAIGQSWSETGVTWNNQPNPMAGLSIFKQFSSDGYHTWSSSSYADLKSLVQAWVDGTKSNYGFFLTREQGYAGDTAYRTREWGTSAQRPELVVSYTHSPSVGSLNVTINPPEARSAPAQWRVDGGSWHDSGYTETDLSVGSHTVEYSPVSRWNTPDNQTVQINAGDTTYTTATYILQEPEINIKQDSTNIPDETGSYDFGRVSLGWSNSATFTIENLGDGNLELTGSPFVQISGVNADEFVVSQQLSTPVTADGSVIFEISFSPAAEGQRTATVSIANNDLDENRYNFSLRGTGGLALTIYVDANSPNEPGLGTPADPYRRIQDAINGAINDDTIVVAEGTYYENINFSGKNITVTSEDPNKPNIVQGTIIDGSHNGPVVIFENGEDANCLLNGFTITNGCTDGYYGWQGGGGIYSSSAHPTISNCIITWNSTKGIEGCPGGAGCGGGLYFRDSNATINNCIVSENSAKGGWGLWNTLQVCNGGDARGGGIYCQNSDLKIINCILANNSANAGEGGGNIPVVGPGAGGNGNGGAIYCIGSNVTLINCVLRNNSAKGGRGGFWVDGFMTSWGPGGNGYGGAIYCLDSHPTVANCAIYKNLAYGGEGGSSPGGYPGGDGCGGGVSCNNGNPQFSNCTINGNVAVGNYGMPGGKGYGYGGALHCSNYSGPTIANCILWSDSATYGSELAVIGDSLLSISYCDIQAGQSQTYLADGSTLNWLAGNINADPLFRDPHAENYHLMADSPCIDTGDNNNVPADTADLDGHGNTVEPIPWDPDGHPRIIDGDCNDTEIVDMGAYEFAWVYIGDFAGGCDVDFKDFAVFALAWLTEEGDGQYNPACDISMPADNSIDWRDLDMLSNNWLTGL